MEQDMHQPNYKHNNPSVPDNIEQRITSMLEDVLKCDSSDEELKNTITLNNPQQVSFVKPLIRLNDMPVPEDIYVINDPNEINFFRNNSSSNNNIINNNSKRTIKKKNNSILLVDSNSNNSFMPKNMHCSNNLAINSIIGNMPKQSQQILSIGSNLNNIGNNLVNSNTLSFNGLGNFNLSPQMEKRTKDKNSRLNVNNIKENNLIIGNNKALNTFPMHGITNKNNLSIPVNIKLKLSSNFFLYISFLFSFSFFLDNEL